MKHVPLRHLAAQTNIGCKVTDMRSVTLLQEDFGASAAHRHGHYLFFLLEMGSASLVVDFEEITIQSSELFYLVPGQIHYPIKTDQLSGWVISVDSHLLTTECVKVLEDSALLKQPQILSDPEVKQLSLIISLLNQKCLEDQQSPLYFAVLNNLIQTFTAMAASCVSAFQTINTKMPRSAHLSQQFKRLLVQHFRAIKSPSQYAAMMNISESYLNEALKNATGFPVSYWITQQVMLEAKRLLFYSQLSVKEIANELGFDDSGYFSRQFKKKSERTPVAFRAHYRK